MNSHFGWEQGSRTVATYNHISGKQVDDQILAMYGKKKIDDKGQEFLQSVQCPRCNIENSPASRLCQYCGFPMRDESAIKIVEKRKKADKIMNVATKYPELMEILENIMKKEGL